MNFFKKIHQPELNQVFSSTNQHVCKSRRLFLKLIGFSSSLVAIKTRAGLQEPGLADLFNNDNGSMKFDAELVVYRPQDLLFLQFRFVNFEIKETGGNGRSLVRKNSDTAYVIIYFQSQSIVETAYLEQDANPSFPAQSIAAEDSRLVYEIPAKVQTIGLSANELLNFSDWKLLVNNRAPAALIYGKTEYVLPDLKLPEMQKVHPDTVKKPLLVKPLVSSSSSKPQLIKKQLPMADVPQARDTAINHASRVADKEKQQQLVFSQLPQQEKDRQERLKNGGAINAIARIAGARSPGPLDSLETSIEMPWRLFMSPSGMHTFAHTRQLKHYELIKNNPVQTYELWHSRLAIQLNGKPSETEAAKQLLTIRALWGADVKEKPTEKVEVDTLIAGPMTAADRHAIVHESSNWTITNYIPRPVKVRRMMLSTLGAWLESNFEVPLQDLEKGICNGQSALYALGVLKWSHLATMARDHYVEIVRAGNIFPFGHKAVHVTITERKPGFGYAYNQKKEFIIITEPEKYFNSRSRVENDRFLYFPFRRITIHTTVTPALSDKENFARLDHVPGNSGSQFVVRVNNTAFPFKISAIDSEGKEIDFEMPLVFVMSQFSGEAGISSLKKIISRYTGTSQAGDAPVITKNAELKNQSFALADSLVPGDTSFEAESIEFGCQLISTTEEFHGFYPTVTTIKIFEPSTEALTGTRRALSCSLVDDKKDNTGQVFAEFSESDEGQYVRFGGNTDKTGGSLSPDFKLSGLSKLQGAFGGSLENMKKLYSDAGSLPEISGIPGDMADFFGSAAEGLVPKLFGYVDLRKLVSLVPPVPGLEAMNGRVNKLLDKLKGLKEDLEKKQALADQWKEKVEKGLASADELAEKIRDLGIASNLTIDAVKNFSIPIPGFKRFRLPTAECFQYNWYPEIRDGEIGFGEILKLKFLPVKASPPHKPGADGSGNAGEENRNRNIYINTLIKKPDLASGAFVPEYSVDAVVQHFTVTLVDILNITFKKVAFRLDKDSKTDFSVDMEEKAITFTGPLSFINKIRDIIPGNGFSDPPSLDVTKEGIKTGYNLAVPDLSIGVFLLGNLNLDAMVNLPFTGAPMTMRFNISEREKPFVLTVAALGGSGFFGIEFDLKGLRTLEASLEFGAALSMDIGVASGEVCVMGGIYFKMKRKENGDTMTELTGFVRINGSMSVLGLISVSVEFYLGLEYNTETKKAWGEATLKVKIELLFFTKTVDLKVRREFKGSGDPSDPVFRMLMPPADWNEYCDGFAA